MTTAMDTAADIRCGRPTTSGRPCRTQLHGYQLACSRHATDADRAAADRTRQAVDAAFQRGVNRGRALAEQEHRLADYTAAREVERAANWRTHTPDGRQLIQFNGYTYAWAGAEPLAVGDAVWVPPNWAFPARVLTVDTLGSDYQGYLVTLTRRQP